MSLRAREALINPGRHIMRFLTIFTLLFLAACGQTGKLYLPEPVQPEPVAPAATPETATETAESASPDKAKFEAELKSQPQKQP